MSLTITTIVCAYNESRLLPGCLYSLRSQTRPPDDILVINNASTDETGAVARAVPGVRVIDEPAKGLMKARETARRAVVDLCGKTRRFDVIAITDHILMKRDMLARAGRLLSLGRREFSVTEERFQRANVDIDLTLYRNGS